MFRLFFYICKFQWEERFCNFLYWNVNKKNLSKYIVDACIENNSDVVVLTEYENIDIRYLTRRLADKKLEFSEEIIDPKSRILMLKKMI